METIKVPISIYRNAINRYNHNIMIKQDCEKRKKKLENQLYLSNKITIIISSCLIFNIGYILLKK